MKINKFCIVLILGLVFLGPVVGAQANVMTNFTGWQEDGILLTNNLGSSFGNGSGALYLDGMYQVTISMVNQSLFNLNTVYFDFNSAPVGFLFSNGVQYSIPANQTPSVLDFSAFPFAYNLNYFTIYGNDPGGIQISEIVVTPASVPEPSTMLLFGAGLAGLGLMRKRFKG